MSSTLRDSDIVCGRGGLANKHPGNRMLRRICAENKDMYQSTLNPTHKQLLVTSIIMSIEHHGGRFVTQTKNGWEQISDKKKKGKTSQLLREVEAPTCSQTKRRKRTSPQEDYFQTEEVPSKSPDIIPPEEIPDLKLLEEEAVTEDFAEFLMGILPSEKENIELVTPGLDSELLDLIPLDADQEYAFENNKEYQHLCHGLLSVLSN